MTRLCSRNGDTIVKANTFSENLVYFYLWTSKYGLLWTLVITFKIKRYDTVEWTWLRGMRRNGYSPSYGVRLAVKCRDFYSALLLTRPVECKNWTNSQDAVHAHMLNKCFKCAIVYMCNDNYLNKLLWTLSEAWVLPYLKCYASGVLVQNPTSWSNRLYTIWSKHGRFKM